MGAYAELLIRTWLIAYVLQVHKSLQYFERETSLFTIRHHSLTLKGTKHIDTKIPRIVLKPVLQAKT
jgi:hypothetical protein